MCGLHCASPPHPAGGGGGAVGDQHAVGCKDPAPGLVSSDWHLENGLNVSQPPLGSSDGNMDSCRTDCEIDGYVGKKPFSQC